jgi:hypothetical protein
MGHADIYFTPARLGFFDLFAHRITFSIDAAR